VELTLRLTVGRSVSQSVCLHIEHPCGARYQIKLDHKKKKLIFVVVSRIDRKSTTRCIGNLDKFYKYEVVFFGFLSFAAFGSLVTPMTYTQCYERHVACMSIIVKSTSSLRWGFFSLTLCGATQALPNGADLQTFTSGTDGIIYINTTES
jgi:hypothetical protein